MVAGLQVTNTNGYVQIDENYYNMVLAQHYTFASDGPTTVTYTGSVGVAPIPVLYSTNTNGIQILSQSNNGSGSYSYKVWGIGDLYLFDRAPPTPRSSGVGLQVIRSDGTVAFDSALNAMKVCGVLLQRPHFDVMYYPTQTISNTSCADGNVGDYNVLTVEPAAARGVTTYPLTKPTAQIWGWVAGGNPRCWFYNDNYYNDLGHVPYGVPSGHMNTSIASVFASGDNFKFKLREFNLSGGTYSPVYSSSDIVSFLFVDITNLITTGASTTSVTMTPGSSSVTTNATSSNTFSETVTGYGGTPISYAWSLSGQTGGTWAIASGQGTATATVSVTSVASSVTATASLTCLVGFNAQPSASAIANLQYTNAVAPAPTATMSPGNQTLTANSASSTMNLETITVSNGTASGYAWSILSPSGGTFTLNTPTAATCTPSVSGVTAGVTATATVQCVTTIAGTGYTSSGALSFKNTTGGTSVAVAPTSQTMSGTATSNTFSAETATVTGGTATSYAWTVVTSSNGTFSLANASSASCTPSVTGVLGATTATATVQCVTVVAGTNYTNTATLSYQNTSAAGSGVTFSPVAGTYSVDDGGTSTSVNFSITASASVTWTWTKSGTGGTSNVVSGNAASSITLSQGVGTADRSATFTVTASGAGTGTWTVTLSTLGTGTLCVVLDTYVPRHGQARWVKVGDYLDIAHPVTFAERRGLVSRADHTTGECVRITTRSGIELECTTTAPIAVKDGSMVLAPDLLGHTLPVKDNGLWGHDEVVAVEPIGVHEIAHITCEDDVFLAGKHDGRYVLHHNLKA